jgi:hypothetical protein
VTWKSSIEKKVGPLGVGDGSLLQEYKRRQLGKEKGIHKKYGKHKTKDGSPQSPKWISIIRSIHGSAFV